MYVICPCVVAQFTQVLHTEVPDHEQVYATLAQHQLLWVSCIKIASIPFKQ